MGESSGRCWRSCCCTATRPSRAITLVDALWGERPPRSAAESLDSYLYRLRKLLGHDRLAHEAGGYLLRRRARRVRRRRVRATRRERGARRLRAAIIDAALSELTVALALWRGPAWGDLLDGDALEADAQRLEELRLSALESRFEAELALGHGADLAPELERLVDEHPLRERLIASLMLALYRAGRQTDALDAFQVARRQLVDELGLEPGPELQELQRRILEHDPTLGAPSRFPRCRCRVLAGSCRPLRWSGSLRSLAGCFVLGAGAVNQQALAAGVSGVVAVQTASDRVAVDAAGRDARFGGGRRRFGVGGGPGCRGGCGESIQRPAPRSTGSRWAPTREASSTATGRSGSRAPTGSTVTRIDPTTETVAPTIQLPGANPDAIAFGAGRLWVADSSMRELFEIDPAGGRAAAHVAVGSAAERGRDRGRWRCGSPGMTTLRSRSSTLRRGACSRAFMSATGRLRSRSRPVRCGSPTASTRPSRGSTRPPGG